MRLAQIRIALSALVMLATLSGCPEPCESADRCSVPTEPTGRIVQLTINPIPQQTEVWCWAATAEMVFRHYGLPSVNQFGNYQCGIVAAYFGGACTLNCGLCVQAIGSMSELQRVVNQYGLVARGLGLSSPVLTSQLTFSYLTFTEVKQQIDANRPIIAGISAGGFPFPNISQHVVLVVGYRDTASPTLIVNDPFPYDLPIYVLQGNRNPYIAIGATRTAPGRYEISYSEFVRSLVWANSIYNIHS